MALFATEVGKADRNSTQEAKSNLIIGAIYLFTWIVTKKKNDLKKFEFCFFFRNYDLKLNFHVLDDELINELNIEQYQYHNQQSVYHYFRKKRKKFKIKI